MMWGYTDGSTMVWMGAMMILFWGGVVALIAFGIRSFSNRRSGDPAMETLRRRLASGDISQDEFDKTRKALG